MVLCSLSAKLLRWVFLERSSALGAKDHKILARCDVEKEGPMITMVVSRWREWLNGNFGAALNTTYVGIQNSTVNAFWVKPAVE